MEGEVKSGQMLARARLLSNESLSMSESEYSALLSNLSPRHKSNDQVEISISSFSKAKDKHVIYKITGKDLVGSYETHRRYNDFLLIRSILASQWPGCYIPKLPPKKRIVSFI